MVKDLFNIFMPYIALVLAIIFQTIFGMLRLHSLVFKYKDINIVISNTISLISIVAAIFFTLAASNNYAGLNYSIIMTPAIKALSVLVLIVGLITVLLNTNLLRENRQSSYKYHVLLLTSLLGAILAISANDFLTLFVSLEALSFSLYFLIALPKGYTSKEAGFKYLITNAVSVSFFLFGVSCILGLTSSLNFSEIAHILQSEHNGIIYTAASIMIMIGLLMKLAIFPFANWVIDVYNGCETSVLNFLSTVPKIVVIGVIIRLLSGAASYSVELNTIILLLGLMTAFWANIYALKENNVKKIMACSSAANAGYMIIVLSVFSAFAASAVIFYLICYTFINMGIFSYLNLIEQDYKNITLDKLSSNTSIPISISFVICVLGLAGLPVASGFAGKIFLLYSMLQSGLVFLPVMLLLLLLFVIALYYYIKLIRGIIPQNTNITKGVYPQNPFIEPVLCMMAIITFILGVMPFSLAARCLLFF